MKALFGNQPEMAVTQYILVDERIKGNTNSLLRKSTTVLLV
jgi:hypothetical protein